MNMGKKHFRTSCAYVCFLLLGSLILIFMSSLHAIAFDNPVMLNQGYANPGGKPIIRTSTGRTYYFIGDVGHTGQWDGWIEAHTSLNGSSWSQVSAEDQWNSAADFCVAVDSQNVVHMITYDWTYHPVYKKFNTADSPKADHSWEGQEMMESRSTSAYALSCAIAIDGNDAPHVIYPSSVALKGNKSQATLIYANKVGGIWHKTDIRTLDGINSSAVLDIAIGPDNAPYIQSGTKIIKGNSNNPTAFESMDLGVYSFVIHQNGDVRGALSSNGYYANYLHDHTRQWNEGWELQVSSTPDKGGVLTLAKDVPYMVKTVDEGLAVQKLFDQPVLLASKPLSAIWQYPASRWSFYNNNNSGIIDLGFQSYVNQVTKYFWYTKYLAATDASFLSATTYGYGPLEVQFRDISVAAEGKTLVSWEWDFNNDALIDSTLQNPTTVYTGAGKYTVSLTVTDSGGNKDTVTKKDYIEVKAGVDTDKDKIADDLDNCPTVYNPAQTDLNGNGNGDACEGPLDMFHQALFSVGLRKETTSEKNSQNITALMKDDILTQGVRVKKSNQFDVVSFTSNVEAGKLANFILKVYVSNVYGGISQPVRIYPYNADGLTVQNTAINWNINLGWNEIDLTPILHAMNGMGFVKFRLVAVQNWLDIAEAYLTEMVDNREISANPLNPDFGSLEVGKSSAQNISITNTGLGELIINAIKAPSSPFSVINDGCSGHVLSASSSCGITMKFSPSTEGTFHDSLLVLSNDADNPSFRINLSGTAVLPTAVITGTTTDFSTGVVLPNVTVIITDSGGSYSTITDSSGKYTFTELAGGGYTAIFSKAGYISQTTSGSISSGQILSLNISLVSYPPISISIASPQNWAVLNATPASVTGTVSNNAKVTVNGLEALVNGNTFSASVTLNEGQNTIIAAATDQYNQTASQGITVTLAVKGSIIGTVTDSSTGLALSSATVSVTDSLNAPLTTLTNSGGQYNINGLAPGAFSGSITKSEFNVYNFTGTIAAGQTETVNASLNPILPVISNITANNINSDSAAISWTTDQPSDSVVEYGETTAYGNSVSAAALVTAHSITLNNLSPDKTYHFKATSKNAAGYSTSSGDQTCTTLSPPPPSISGITVSNLTFNSAVVTWTTDQATSSLLEYGSTPAYGNSVSDSALATVHSLQLQNLTQGTLYHFRIAATNVYDSSSASEDSMFTTLSPISITILSPADNAVINRPEAMVKGTITNSTGNETGVTVNGMVATMYGSQFIANRVPLTEGSNTITVTATDTAGNSLSKAIAVNAVPTGNYIRITSNIESGIPPLQTTLKIGGSFSITASDISVRGPGTVEFLPGEAVDEYAVKMTTEGIYYFTATVTGPDNLVYQDTVAVTVLNKTELDTLLKGKWELMLNSLSLRDTAGALLHIATVTRPIYEQMFNEIIDQLPAIVATQRELNILYATNNMAKYELVTFENNKLYSYEVTFGKNDHGFWKIVRY